MVGREVTQLGIRLSFVVLRIFLRFESGREKEALVLDLFAIQILFARMTCNGTS